MTTTIATRTPSPITESFNLLKDGLFLDDKNSVSDDTVVFTDENSVFEIEVVFTEKGKKKKEGRKRRRRFP